MTAALIADIRRRGIGAIVQLGDSVYGPLEPSRPAELLMSERIPGLRGNQDRILLEPCPNNASPTFDYVTSLLSEPHFEWLRAQPRTIEYGPLFLCHGTPASDETYLTEFAGPQGAALRDRTEIEALIAGVTQTIIVCGHSHLPRLVALRFGRLVVNPGSVGLPAYSDDLPFPHRMESASPHARYAVIDDGRVNQIAIEYDYRRMAATARRNGRPDWAIAIETGFSA